MSDRLNFFPFLLIIVLLFYGPFAYPSVILEYSNDYIDIYYDFCMGSSDTYTGPDGRILPQNAFALAVPPAASYDIRLIDYKNKASNNVFKKFPPCPEYQHPVSGDGISVESPLDRILLVNHGELRFQHIITINIRPVLFSGDKSIIYNYLHFRVYFNDIQYSRIRRNYSSADHNVLWENTLQNFLLNYEYGKDFRVKQSRDRTVDYPFEIIDDLPVIQLSVQNDGLYIIKPKLFYHLGIDPSDICPSTFQIFDRRGEIPIIVHGEDTGTFDNDDYILFFGQAPRRPHLHRNILDNNTHYFLTFSRDQGRRYVHQDSFTEDHVNSFSFPASVLFEKNLIHDIYHIYNHNPHADNFFWSRIDAPAVRVFPFALFDICHSVDYFDLNIYLAGVTSLDVSPDHHYIVRLNGNIILDDYFDGRVSHLGSTSFPSYYLANGLNFLSVQAVGDTTPNNIDSIYLDWFSFDYLRKYNIQRGNLLFEPPFSPSENDPVYKLQNISSPELLLLDTRNGIIFKNYSLNFNLSSMKYDLIFQDHNASSRLTPNYYLIEREYIIRPDSAKLIDYADILCHENGADLLLIYHDKFYSAIDILSSFYEDRGFSVFPVPIGDIYAIFSFGHISITALSSFVQYVYNNWQQVPSHITIFGGATYDPMHFIDSSFKHNYIPSWGEPANDFYYALGSQHNEFLDFYISRIPAQTTAEALSYVNKVINYSYDPLSGDWQNKTLFINGGMNSSEQTIFLYQTNMIIEDFVCPSFERDYEQDCNTIIISKTTPGCNWDEYNGIIDEYLHSGVSIVNFFGHAGSMTWDCMYSTEDVASLVNAPRLPVVFSNTCFTAAFDNPTLYSLSELFTTSQPSGGAIAFVGQPLLGYMWGGYYLARQFFRHFYENAEPNIGKAVTEARLSFFLLHPEYTSMYHLTNLLGDGFADTRLFLY